MHTFEITDYIESDYSHDVATLLQKMKSINVPVVGHVSSDVPYMNGLPIFQGYGLPKPWDNKIVYVKDGSVLPITPAKYAVISDSDDGIQTTFYFYDDYSLQEHFENIKATKRGNMKINHPNLDGLPVYEEYSEPIYVAHPCVVYRTKEKN